jgi:hypothetical protein
MKLHMKLPPWLQTAIRPAMPSTPLRPTGDAITLAAAAFDEVAEPRNRALLAASRASLDDQMHEVIDRNADGVNHSAIGLRRETDMLLALGISDPLAAKAGSYAQQALELANSGRGVNLQAQPHHLTLREHSDLVARAMALMLRAEMLMAAAKKSNLANIEAALARQEQLMANARHTLLAQPSIGAQP